MCSHQHRGHAGHSHGNDNAYLTSANRNDAGVKITRIGLYVNLAMAVGKGIGGYVFHSQALVADAFHSLTDLVSDFMTLATVSWSLSPPSDRFPYGYGKIESLGALGVSGVLLLGGAGMAMNGLDALYQQFFFSPEILAHAEEHSHSLFSFMGHNHSHGAVGPSLNAAWLAAGSIVVKEWLYRATMKIAKERKSAVLASNAVHHRIDSLTSVVALMTIAGSHVLSNAAWLDPIGGLIISAMVIRAGWANTMSSILELADVSVEADVTESVKRVTKRALVGKPEKGISGVALGNQVEIRDVQGVKSGQNYLIDIDLAVPATFTISDTEPIENAVRERCGLKIKGVRKVRVKFTPLDSEKDFEDEFIEADLNPISSPEVEEDHDHEHDHGHNRSHAHFDSQAHSDDKKNV